EILPVVPAHEAVVKGRQEGGRRDQGERDRDLPADFLPANRAPGGALVGAIVGSAWRRCLVDCHGACRPSVPGAVRLVSWSPASYRTRRKRRPLSDAGGLVWRAPGAGYNERVTRLAVALALIVLTATDLAAQSAGTSALADATPSPRAPYLQRGDEVEGRYRAYRERLERFFEALSAVIAVEAPELRPSL